MLVPEAVTDDLINRDQGVVEVEADLLASLMFEYTRVPRCKMLCHVM